MSAVSQYIGMVEFLDKSAYHHGNGATCQSVKKMPAVIIFICNHHARGLILLMSRLDSAIDSIQNAVDELRGAVDAHLAQAENHSDNVSADHAANGAAEIHEDELRAMKSELHKAMTLLQAIQNPAQNQEGQ